jgi:translocation and assembly module TamB
MLRRAGGTEVRWDARGVEMQPHLLLANPALGALRGRLSTNGALRSGGGVISTLAGKLSLDWEGALIAGRAVDRLVLVGSAEAGVVAVEHAEGRIGPNEIQLLKVALPAGPLVEGRWRALLAAAAGTFSASLGDVPAFLALWGVRAGDGATTVPEHRLRLEGSLEKGTLRLARGDLTSGLGKAALAAAAVTFPREDQGWGETAFSGAAGFDIPKLKDVSALFPVPPLSGSLRGEIAGTGTFALPEGRASLTGRGITIAGRSLGDLELQARSTTGSIEIDTLQLRQGGNLFTAQGIRFSTAALTGPDRSGFFDSLAGSFTLSAADIPSLAALAGIPPGQVARTPAKHLLTAAGTVQGRTIAITAGSFAAAGGSIVLRAVRVALPPAGADWRKETTVEGDVEVDIPDLGPIATIFQAPKMQGTLKGRARISGSLGAPGGSVAASGRGIAIDGHRVGDLVVTAAAQRQRLSIETLEVTRGEDRLRGRGSYDLEKRTVLEAEADVSVADVAPYLAEFVREGIPVSGRLHAALRAAGPVPGTPLVIETEFSDGHVGKLQGVRGVAHAQYEPGRLRIGAFEVTGSGGLAVKGDGTIPLDLAADAILSPGPIAIAAQASVPALEEFAFLVPPAYALTGSLRAAVGVTGSWKAPEGRLEIRGERLQLPTGTRFAPPGPFTLAGTLTWGTAEAKAEKVLLESPVFSASLSGTWASPPPLAALFSEPPGAMTGSLSLRTSFNSPDIGWLRNSVAGLRGLRGGVAGEIAVDGPAGDPLLTGEIRIVGAAFRFQDLPPIDALTATATVAGRRVSLKEFGGNAGGSPFTLAGSLDFSRPENPVLDLRLQGKNTLLYRDEGLRVRADSDLTLRGPLSALSLTGEMALTNSLYQKNISIASLFTGGDKPTKRQTPGLAEISFTEPPLRDMRFDVRLTAREPFEIRTSVVRGAARPDLRLTGTGLLPILRGPILVDTARVMLPSGTLEVERGTVLFSEGDPGRPTLDFGGRLHALGYDITAQIGGTRDSPEVILSSTPPLPREELLLFVLTGVPPGSGSGGGGSVTAMASPMAVYLGKNVLEQLLGKGSRTGKTPLQDRLELQIGRELTRSGSVTVDARLLFKKDPIAHDSSLYITSEKDIYDQYNAGLKILFKFK